MHKEQSESLTCLFLFGHSTDVLALCFTCRCSGRSAYAPALDGPGCCGLSTDVVALFSAASSGSVYLRFPSVIELSICVMYVNCSTDFFVILSNLAFYVWCIFSNFSKLSSKLLLAEVRTAASASQCLPGDSNSFFTCLINLKKIKWNLLKNFFLPKVGVQNSSALQKFFRVVQNSSALITCPSSKPDHDKCVSLKKLRSLI